MIDVTDTPHGLHLDADGGTPVTLSPDAVAAIVEYELGKLGLWWAEEQRALVLTAPAADGYIVLLPDGVASGAHWTAVGAKASTPLGRRLGGALAAYLATLFAEPELPKPGETWELNDSIQTWEATVVEICGTLCFAWPGTTAPSLRPVDNMGRCTRRKIADAPSGADQ